MNSSVKREVLFWAQNPEIDGSDYIALDNRMLKPDEKVERSNIISKLGEIKMHGVQRAESRLIRIWESGVNFASEVATDEKDGSGRSCWILVAGGIPRDETQFPHEIADSVRWFSSQIDWRLKPRVLSVLSEELHKIQKRKQKGRLKKILDKILNKDR